MTPIFGLGFLFLLAVVGGSFLSYDHQRRQLRFQCPEPGSVDSPDLLHAQVSRVPVGGYSGNSTLLAEWEINGKEKTGNSLHSRVKVYDNFTATLENVTCYDSVAYTYTCTKPVDKKNSPNKDENQSFQFIGETTQPVINQHPLKSRYEAGETLALNCTALVGSRHYRLVWEAGFLGRPFSPVTGERDSQTADEEVQVVQSPCTWRSYLPLLHPVKAEDDGKIFQCRVTGTDLTSQIIIAVRTDRDKCGRDVAERIKESESSDLQQGVDLQVSKRQSTQSGEDSADTGEEGGFLTASTALIIVVAIVAAMLVATVVGFIVLRRLRRKQLSPLIVIETPPSSESGYADRRLPNLPDLGADAGPNTTTVPKWIAETHFPHLDSSLNSATYPDLSSTSVYVSMTAMNRCGEPGTGDDVTAEAETQQEAADLVPDMRAERSESVYSNEAAMKREVPAVSPSACVDRLKWDDGRGM